MWPSFVKVLFQSWHTSCLRIHLARITVCGDMLGWTDHPLESRGRIVCICRMGHCTGGEKLWSKGGQSNESSMQRAFREDYGTYVTYAKVSGLRNLTTWHHGLQVEVYKSCKDTVLLAYAEHSLRMFLGWEHLRGTLALCHPLLS